MFRKSPSGHFESAVKRAGQAAFVERDARDDGDAVLLAVRKQLVFRRLIEDVVDHLHAVDEPGVERAQHVGRFPAVDADPERADQALALQIVDGALPAFVRRPTRRSRRGTAGGPSCRGRGSRGSSPCTRGCASADRSRRSGTRPCPATACSSAESWWRLERSDRRVVRASSAPDPAAVRSCRRHTPTPCRRNCSRARTRARARAATARHPIRSSRPCPTCRSRLPRPASRCVRTCDSAYRIFP